MKTVMSIGAHPDDIEIGCAGTEILLREQGYRLIHVIATNGEEGSLEIPPEELSKRRQQEAIRSAEVLGADSVEFLNLPDGLTDFDKAAKINLIKLIRKYKPEIVFTHSSSDHFPDHAVVHKLTQAALGAAKGPWYSGAAGSPHSVEKVFGYEVWHPLNQHQMSINISSVMDKKIQALKEHYSQVDGVNYLAAVEGLAKYRGAMTMTGEFAEVFEILQITSVLTNVAEVSSNNDRTAQIQVS